MELESLLRGYVEEFNSADDELYPQEITNAEAADWLTAHAPKICVPDKIIERTFYFRLWTYRKHIKKTDSGYVVTEFLPQVSWSGEENTISCPTGHQFSEGRWFHHTDFLTDYMRFWYLPAKPHLTKYSNYIEDGIKRFFDIRGGMPDENLLAAIAANDLALDENHLDRSGLYWSNDNRDGSEYSVSGSGLRTTMNSYRYAAATALAGWYDRIGDNSGADYYGNKAESIKRLVNERLWDEDLGFYRTVPMAACGGEVRSDAFRIVRENFGYLPWTFGLAWQGRGEAFRQLFDPDGFLGKYGITTTERRNPGFGLFYRDEEFFSWLISRGEPIPKKNTIHECLWNGPVWPFATSLVLRGMANYLNSEEENKCVSKDEYCALLCQYAASHKRMLPDGRYADWIDENQDPDTGEWISRKLLQNGGWTANTGGLERGRDYNHSTFCDLVLEGLLGLHVNCGELDFKPLIPDDWEYAEIDDVYIGEKKYHLTYKKNSGWDIKTA